MELNQTLETTTFEIPENIDTTTPLMFKAFEHNSTEFERLEPARPHPEVRPTKTTYPSPIQRMIYLVQRSMFPENPCPYLVASIGSNYAFSIRNSQKIEVRVSSGDNTKPLTISLQHFTKIYKGEGISAICFASSSLLVVTSYNSIFVFSLMISKSNKLSVSTAFMLNNSEIKLLKEEEVERQPRMSLFYWGDFTLPNYDLLCASHDGRFAFVSESGSRSVKMVSLSEQVIIKEFSFVKSIHEMDCNQEGSLLALAHKASITLFDTISGRETYIENIRPECLAFYKATLFKPENCISPAFTDISKDTQINDDDARLEERHQTTLQETMMSLQLQTNHRSLDYQMPEYEFLAFANENDVTCFVYSIHRRVREIEAYPAVGFDFVRRQHFGGKIDCISWCDGLLASKCEDNIILCATREDGDGISGVVSAAIIGVGSELGCITVGRCIAIGCEHGLVVFENIE